MLILTRRNISEKNNIFPLTFNGHFDIIGDMRVAKMKYETCLICDATMVKRQHDLEIYFSCISCGHWFIVDVDGDVIAHEEIDPCLGSYNKTFGEDE